MKSNLRLRTNLLLCAILIAGFAAASLLIVRGNAVAFRENIERIATLTSNGIYYQSVSYFAEPINISTAMANGSMLKRFLADEPQEPDSGYLNGLREYLDAYRAKYGYASAFLVSAKTGVYYHFSGQYRALARDDPQDAWYYDFLEREDEYSFDVGVDKFAGEMYFVDCKIYGEDGRVLGVLGVGFHVDALNELIARYRKDYDVAMMLIGARSTSKIARREYAARFSEFRHGDEKMLEELVAKAGLGQTAVWGEGEHSDCYMVARYVPELQCYLVVENDMSAWRGKFVRRMLIGACVSALVGVLVLAVINYVMSSYNKRLLEMTLSREMKDTREELRQRGEMLDLLNRAAITLLTQNEESFVETMSDGVEFIAGLSNIDRVTVSRNVEKPDGLYASQVYYWDKKLGSAVKPLEELQDNPYDRLTPRWKDVLASGECINGPVRLMPEAEALKKFECVTILAIPVFIKSSFWGFVLFEDLQEEREFSEAEVDILRSAGFMLANVIMSHDGKATVEYQNRLLRTVNQISVILLESEAADFDSDLLKSMGIMAEAVGADRAYIWENYVNDGELYCYQTYKWSEGAPPQQGRDILQGISYRDSVPSWEKAFLQKKCVNGIVRDLSPSEHDLLAQQGILSLLVVPIYVKDCFWGFVGFDDCHRERVYTENEETILRSASELIASALIRNDMERDIKTLETEVDKIYYDPLTGICNRRYLDENLKRVYHTLSRSGSELSVMMVDIDHFKKYNDTYGHALGDVCLKAVACTLRNSVARADDFVARYGGEEFAVVLPNTDEDGARLIAEKMLEGIRSCKIPHEKSSAADCVTFSIGVATGTAASPYAAEDFIRRADEMMYVSKKSGRNRYSLAGMESRA
jgi:diguanylate cyclase (GGDEF)-like protein